MRSISLNSMDEPEMCYNDFFKALNDDDAAKSRNVKFEGVT